MGKLVEFLIGWLRDIQSFKKFPYLLKFMDESKMETLFIYIYNNVRKVDLFF